MRNAPSLFALTALAVLATSTSAQYAPGAPDSLTARVDSIFRQYDRTDSPGCAVGVFRNGRIVYARGYGMASLELGVPISPRTVFSIASVSKQFTAAAIVLLAQDGKISLEDLISRYFPEMPQYANGITVRQMLNHTGGLRNYQSLVALQGRTEAVADTGDYLRVITRSSETNFPPGMRFLYSNSDYMLAGQMVYRVTGRSLGAFLKERVFDPLAMTKTHFLDDPTLIVPGRAQEYAAQGTGFRLALSQGIGTGAGGVKTTVEDFARWDHNWDDATIGGRALVDALVVPGRLRNDSTIGYALGVEVGTYRGLRTIEHQGEGNGSVAMYLRFPDQRVGVTCFCNFTSPDPDALARRVAEVYLGPQMLPDTIEAATTKAILAALVRTVPVAQLRRFEGAWSNLELGRRLRTRVEGDSLVVVHSGRWLAPLGGNRFRLSGLGFELVFDKDADGVPQRLLARDGQGRLMTFNRASPVYLSSEQLREYTGRYRSDEIETTYLLALSPSLNLTDTPRGGSLAVRIGDGAPLGRLEPFSRDTFILVDSPIGTNVLFAFRRHGDGRVAGFAIDTERVRHLRFVRKH